MLAMTEASTLQAVSKAFSSSPCPAHMACMDAGTALQDVCLQKQVHAGLHHASCLGPALTINASATRLQGTYSGC